jgi:hypothetical protein
MSEAWYRAAGAEEPLTQGDLIFECPALSWRLSALQPPAGSVAEDLSLGEHLIAEARDLVVMTQACDLEHAKVTNTDPSNSVRDPRAQTGEPGLFRKG